MPVIPRTKRLKKKRTGKMSAQARERAQAQRRIRAAEASVRHLVYEIACINRRIENRNKRNVEDMQARVYASAALVDAQARLGKAKIAFKMQ